MPANGLSTGIDSRLTFNDVTGVQRFMIIESVQAKEDATVGKQIAMDGTVRHPKFHEGWSGTFVLQRGDNSMDNYIALQEASYYLGVDQIPMTITQTITEVSGSISQYQYTNVVISLDDSGMWSGTDIVKQTVTFMASRKLELVNNA